MRRIKSAVSVALAGDKGGTVGRPCRNADHITETDLFIQKAVEDPCAVGALHSAALYHQSVFCCIISFHCLTCMTGLPDIRTGS